MVSEPIIEHLDHFKSHGFHHDSKIRQEISWVVADRTHITSFKKAKRPYAMLEVCQAEFVAIDCFFISNQPLIGEVAQIGLHDQGAAKKLSIIRAMPSQLFTTINQIKHFEHDVEPHKNQMAVQWWIQQSAGTVGNSRSFSTRDDQPRDNSEPIYKAINLSFYQY